MRRSWSDTELKSSRSHKEFALVEREGGVSPEGFGRDTKSSRPKSSLGGLGTGAGAEPKIQSSSTSGVVGLG